MKSRSLSIIRKRFANMPARQLLKRVPQLAALFMLTSGLVLAELVGNKPAYGCSCERPESALIESDRATAVFIGTVSRITPTSLFIRGEEAAGPVEAKDIEFTVFEQWKGNIIKTIRVKTMAYGASCGYSFEVGEAYLVYARQGSYPFWDESELVVGSCGRTTLRANADADIAELNGESFALPADGSRESEPRCGYSPQ